MAFGDTIQSVESSSASSSSTAPSWSAAVAGNLLIVMGATSAVDGSTAWTASGYSVIKSSGTTGNVGGALLYKIAAGGETGTTLDRVTTTGNMRAAMAEIEGPFAASPLDVSEHDTTNLSTVVTSQPSGTTATTAQADALAIAGFAADQAANVDVTRAYSNSFTEIIFGSASVSPARAAAALAKRILSATGTFSSTFSVVDTGDEMYGTIAIFKKLVATDVYGWDPRYPDRITVLKAHASRQAAWVSGVVPHPPPFDTSWVAVAPDRISARRLPIALHQTFALDPEARPPAALLMAWGIMPDRVDRFFVHPAMLPYFVPGPIVPIPNVADATAGSSRIILGQKDAFSITVDPQLGGWSW